MSSANLSQSETALRAEHIRVHAYRVDVDVRDARNADTATFPVTSQIEFTSSATETWVDFIGEVDRVLIDGQEQTIDYDGARIRLTGLPTTRCTVTVVAQGTYSRTGEGLHRFVDPVDGETYLYTQYEPADARRVFPCFEQPDLRAPFTFSLTGPAGWWFGSNQPETQREEVADGVVRVEFAPTETLSTYITCLCAGPYHRVADTWGDLELGLLCRQTLVPYLDAPELFRLTKAGLDWFTTNFGPYPWGIKYDQIFVPEYNLGAMENPGLVTFTEAYLFRSPATPAQLQGRANTLVHEMSHMWFGDLVTPRWWGDLWLKESFAEFMGSHVSVEACGFDEGWVNFATNRKVGAYLADSMPTTHPVVADIPDLEAAKTNFDRITYSKGASALTQLVHYVGLPAFLAGARRYFAAHAFGAATLSDFMAALDAETDRDLSGWVDAWLRTAGHDTVSASVGSSASGAQQLVVERAFAGFGDEGAERPHATTVGLYRLVDGRLTLDRRLDLVLDAGRTSVELTSENPDVVLPNDLDQTFARIALDERSRAVLLDHIADLDPLARAVAWTALWTEVRAGELSPQRYVDAVLAADERQSGVLASLVDRAATAVNRYTNDKGLAERWRGGARRCAEVAAPGSPQQLIWTKAYIRAAGVASEDVRWILAGELPGLDVSVDLTWLVWESLSAQGVATETQLDVVLASDDTATGRIARLRCWAARPDAEVKAEAWRRVHTVGGESNDAVDALLAGFNAPGQEALRAPFAEDYFDGLLTVWDRHPIEIAMRLVRGGFPVGGHAAGAAWLDAHRDAPGTLIRLVREAAYENEVAARIREER